MSTRLTAGELSNKVFEYLCTAYPIEDIKKARWCMDVCMFDDPNIAFYPDMDNMFPSRIRAMEYILEEGLPVWLVQNGANYPMEVFTYKKLEFLFDI